MTSGISQHFNSKEVKKKLKISDCDLMHMRIAGKLKFKKQGNTFLYDKEDIEKVYNEKQNK